MLASILIALFSIAAFVAALSLADSAIKGAAAYKRLNRAVRDTSTAQMAYISVVENAAPVQRPEPLALPRSIRSIGQKRLVPAIPANRMEHLPVAA